MTLQNRVDPQGQFHVVPARGDLMGNEATLGSLLPGSMLLHNGQALLLWQGKLLAWSFDGYQRSTVALPAAARVPVLTPPSVVRVFASGWLPQVHLSAYH